MFFILIQSWLRSLEMYVVGTKLLFDRNKNHVNLRVRARVREWICRGIWKMKQIFKNRWGEQYNCHVTTAVSYTHLDVYKRQVLEKLYSHNLNSVELFSGFYFCTKTPYFYWKGEKLTENKWTLHLSLIHICFIRSPIIFLNKKVKNIKTHKILTLHCALPIN